MSKKFITGLFILVAGIILVGMGIHYKTRVAKAHGDVEMATSPFKETRGIGIAKDLADKKIDSYQKEIRWLFISGIAAALIGVAVMLYPKKRS